MNGNQKLEFGGHIGESIGDEASFGGARAGVMRMAKRIEELEAQVLALTTPEGWQLVPVEPTKEMSIAGCQVPLNKAARHNTVYRAMLSAAPNHEVK